MHKQLPRWLSGKESTCQAGDADSVPGLGRSPGGESGNPLQYSCLGNPMDRNLMGYSPWGCQRGGHNLATKGFLGGSVGKESACNAGDLGSIPELGRSLGEGNGYPLQYSGLENPMDCIVHRVAKSDMTEQLSLTSLDTK